MAGSNCQTWAAHPGEGSLVVSQSFPDAGDLQGGCCSGYNVAKEFLESSFGALNVSQCMMSSGEELPGQDQVRAQVLERLQLLDGSEVLAILDEGFGTEESYLEEHSLVRSTGLVHRREELGSGLRHVLPPLVSKGR